MRLFVYGAGFAGKVLVHYFEICRGQKVDAILISDGHRELNEYRISPRFMNDEVIPIVEISNIQPHDEDKIYLTLFAGKDVVQKNLIDMGFRADQINVAFDVFPNYYDQFFDVFYEKYDINLNDEIMKFGKLRLFNFLKKDRSFRTTFQATLGDEILPTLYGDNTFTVEGPYELFDVKLKEDDTVLDVGANLGLFSCYAADKGCKVYACDPDCRCIEVLKEHQKLYPEKIEVVPLGLSDSIGKIKFYEADDCGISSFSLIRGKTIEHEICTDTIDHLVENGTLGKIDYIKADIEGAERNMLRGAVETLRTQAPKLSICTYHYPEDPELLESIIKEANPNYTVKHAWRKLYAYVEE